MSKIEKSKSKFYVRTFKGHRFYWDRIVENEYDIEDIAHALSMNCRWTGHTKRFYSVAEHCLNCSLMASEKHKLGALLHDANEAYLHDDASPLKWYLAAQGFTAKADLERRVDAAIFERFGVPYPMAEEIHEIDKRMLATEHHDLMPKGQERKHFGLPYDFTCVGHAPGDAEFLYLKQFHKLTRKK